MDDASCNSDGDPNLLNANRNGDGRWLNADWGKPDNRWNRDNGFAFALPQLSSFLSHFVGRVLFILKYLNGFLKLAVPAAQHSSNFINFYR